MMMMKMGVDKIDDDVVFVVVVVDVINYTAAVVVGGGGGVVFCFFVDIHFNFVDVAVVVQIDEDADSGDVVVIMIDDAAAAADDDDDDDDWLSVVGVIRRTQLHLDS